MNTAEIQPVSPRNLAVSLFRNLPALRSRVTKAVELYKAGAVIDMNETEIYVKGSNGTYLIDIKLQSCNCPDKDAPNGVCKHLIAAGLKLASYELPNQLPITLATRVLLPVKKG